MPGIIGGRDWMLSFACAQNRDLSVPTIVCGIIYLPNRFMSIVINFRYLKPQQKNAVFTQLFFSTFTYKLSNVS